MDERRFAEIVSRTFVRRVDYADEMTSTSDRALELAAQNDVETPLLVWCARQTAGRGQRGRTWWSDDGALTFSLLLDRTTEELRRPRISLQAALAVADAMGSQWPELDLGLKWPNDVWLAGGKLGGILVESPGGEKLALGIGLNVNNSLATAPPEIQGMAASLCDTLGQAVDVVALLIEILLRLEERFEQDYDLPSAWAQHCALAGSNIRLQTETETVHGLCRGIDTEGAMLLESNRGQQRHFTGTARVV